MIGDLVYICDAVEKVSILNPRREFPIGFENEGIKYVDEALVNPIPITEDFLRKNFSYDGAEIYYKKIKIDGMIEDLCFRKMYNKEGKCDAVSHYVGGILVVYTHIHELQCILRLLGETEFANNLNL